MIDNVFIPDYMKASSDQGFYQATANNITRRYGTIEWTAAGPVVNGLNISNQFMYPPIYGITEYIERLNNPKMDTKIAVLTVGEIEYIQQLIEGLYPELEQKLKDSLIRG